MQLFPNPNPRYNTTPAAVRRVMRVLAALQILVVDVLAVHIENGETHTLPVLLDKAKRPAEYVLKIRHQETAEEVNAALLVEALDRGDLSTFERAVAFYGRALPSRGMLDFFSHALSIQAIRAALDAKLAALLK